MSSEPIAPERTYRHVVEQPTLRRVVEHFTLLTLLVAVSLYFIGQIQSWKFLQAFQLPNTGVDHSWETFVFLGAVTLINEVPNLLFAPSAQVLKWVVPLLVLWASVWGWRSLRLRSGGPLHRFGKGVLLLLAGLAYLTFLVALGAGWGARAAEIFKASTRAPQRFVLQRDTQDQLPKGFLEANARGTLRQITSTADAVYVYDPALDVTYAVPNRLIVCRIFEPQPR
jgi:hypothetical protein